MKAVILAGGLGTRLSEETLIKPKPMVEIGGKPIIWHILKIYSGYNINEFIICCGYKGFQIKEFFANYFIHSNDISIDLQNNDLKILDKSSENWKITLIDTGDETMTGGRLKRIQKYLGNESFLFTYGDGLADIDIEKLIKFHKSNGKLVTLSAVQPPGRYGSVNIEKDSLISSFHEKPKGDGYWVNGGFFVLEPEAINYIKGDKTIWENEPLKNLAKDGQLAAFKHHGFWQPMDTLKDKNFLNDLWLRGKAPWAKW